MAEDQDRMHEIARESIEGGEPIETASEDAASVQSELFSQDAGTQEVPPVESDGAQRVDAPPAEGVAPEHPIMEDAAVDAAAPLSDQAKEIASLVRDAAEKGKAVADLDRTRVGVKKAARAEADVRDLLDGLLYAPDAPASRSSDTAHAVVEMVDGGQGMDGEQVPGEDGWFDQDRPVGANASAFLADVGAEFGSGDQPAQDLVLERFARPAQAPSPELQGQQFAYEQRTMPMQPVQTDQPAQPVQPVQGEHPMQPVQPMQGEQPVQPMQPAYDQQPAQPMQPAYDQQPQPFQPAQNYQQSAPAGGQGYWQGFVPVGAPQFSYSDQAQPAPMTGAQPAPTVGMQPASTAGMQPAPTAGMQPGQPAPEQWYAQPSQQSMYRQGGADATQSYQPAPAASFEGHPVSATGAQPVPGQQPYASAQPYAGGGQPYAGSSQAYTPQLQQPAPYTPADDLTVPEQPNTPGYAKSKRTTLPIVIAIVVGLVAILAAIAIGRVLSTASDADNSLINQMTGIAESSSDEGSSADSSGGSYYNEHNWGSGGSGSSGFENADSGGSGTDSSGNGGGAAPGAPDSGQNNGSPGYTDQWSDSWSPDEMLEWLNNNGMGNGQGDGGAVHIYGGGIDADDGELHDAWDGSVSYTVSKEEFNKEATEQSSFYGMDVAFGFNVEYPQLSGNIENLDAINAAIKDAALRTVSTYYDNPDENAKKLFDIYAPAGSADSGSSSSGSGSGNAGARTAIIESDVDYAISYNTEDFISVTFSDEYDIGSQWGGFIELRTVNANLKTGEFYEVGDVITVNEEIAGAFVDNLSTYDNGSSIRVAGRDNFIKAIMGEGDEAKNVSTTFYVDGNGKVNLGVTYALGGTDAMVRGWWDYTLTDEQLEAAKKDSSMWDALAKG